jgi:phospholipase/lecithinase/hemolysin
MLCQLTASIACAILLGARGISAAPKTFKHLVAFGDSYTDKIHVGDGKHTKLF